MSSVVLAFIRDLFWVARVREQASRMSLQVFFVSSVEEIRSEFASPRLVLVDLGDAALKPVDAVRSLKARFPSAKVVCFYPHVREDLLRDAKGAGCDVAVANSVFSQKMNEFLSG